MSKEIIPIAHLIFVFRERRVMLDSDLARLYGVFTGHLNRAVEAFHFTEQGIAMLSSVLMAPPDKPRREIGFHVREKAPRYRARKRA
jgi:hypothetical protein